MGDEEHMCGHCGRSEKSKHRRNALVVIDRGDKEDCCCLQRTDIKLQAFFTLKRRGEVVFRHKILSRPSPPKTDLKSSLKIRRRLRPNASKFLPEGNLYRGITMDGFLRAEHKIDPEERESTIGRTSVANGGRGATDHRET